MKPDARVLYAFISRLAYLALFVMLVYALAVAAVQAWGQAQTSGTPEAPTCSTDPTTKRVTCVGTVLVEEGAVYNVSGSAKNDAGQTVTFGPSIMPPCLRASHEIKDGALTITWTCEEGFTITFKVERRP